MTPWQKREETLRAQLARAEKVIRAARGYFRIYDNPLNTGGIPLSEIVAARNTMREAIWEYDRPSAPLDGREGDA